MSYVSILKNIPEILSQPAGIAAVASLGIHGAIALIVPLMPVDSAQSPKTDSSQAHAVGLMELSPTDQSRLPQTKDPSQVALQTSPLPLQQQLPPANLGNSQSTIMPPLEPPLPSQQGMPSILKSSANYSTSYLPRRQPLQSFAGSSLRSQVSNFRARTSYSSPESPFVNDIDAKIRETQPLDVNRLPQVQADNRLPEEPLNNPSPDAIDIGSSRASGSSQPQKMQSGDNGVQIAANPSEISSAQSSQGASELASAPKGLLPSPETTTQQPRELSNFNQSDSQVRKKEQLLANLNSYNSLRKTVQQEYPNVREQAVIRETISTNKRDIEGTVLGRLVIAPDGKVLDIKFQDRSIAPELQSKTREFFSANPPKVSKQTSSYPFQLRFKKNNDSNNVPETSVKIKPLQNQDSQTLSESKDRKNLVNDRAVVIPNPSPVEETQPTVSTTESSQKLIQNLRQIKEERQKSNQKK
jgi:hypothetical protein